MSQEANIEGDAYLYADSSILRNLADIRDQNSLSKFESDHGSGLKQKGSQSVNWLRSVKAISGSRRFSAAALMGYSGVILSAALLHNMGQLR